MQMDTTTYDRPSVQTPSYGGFEPRRTAPIAIVVHSTSNPNQKNTPFESEARFLFTDKLAGAHYLVGKDGRAVRFFEPRSWAAWHAGQAQAAFSNQRSIGIELHHSVGDDFYPQPQLTALRELLLSLMAQFAIPLTAIETHGQIAIAGPYKRKTDPADWPYARFVQWRNTLGSDAPAPLPPTRYRVRSVLISQRQEGGAPYAGELRTGDVVDVDKTYSNGMAHLADGRGFVLLSALEAV